MTTEAPEYPKMMTLPLSELVKNSSNPNEQDERTFNALCQSIEEEGWVEPMATVVPIAGEDKYSIVGGHHRYDAAEVLGIESGPCWVLDPEKFDEDRQKWTMVKVNILKGKLNPTKFTSLYNDMVKAYGAETLQTVMGFTSEDAFKSLYQDVKKNLPPELAKQLEAQKGEIKTIDQLSILLNKLFSEHGENLPANFMTFSFGGKEVFWVQCDSDLWKIIKKIEGRAVEEQLDMTEVMKSELGDFAAGSGAKVAGMEPTQSVTE